MDRCTVVSSFRAKESGPSMAVRNTNAHTTSPTHAYRAKACQVKRDESASLFSGVRSEGEACRGRGFWVVWPGWGVLFAWPGLRERLPWMPRASAKAMRATAPVAAASANAWQDMPAVRKTTPKTTSSARERAGAAAQETVRFSESARPIR